MKKIFSCILLCALLLSLLSGCTAETFTEEHYAADPAQVAQIQLDLRDRQVEVSASTDGRSTFAIPKAIANFTASRRKTEF